MQIPRIANRRTPRTSRTRLMMVAAGCAALFWGVAAPAWADAVTDYNLALQWYKQGRWELAVEACRDFLKKYPSDEQANSARLYLGQALVHLRDFRGAREEFRRFLRDAPQHQDRPLAAYRVGESSYFLNDLPAAQNELRAFLTAYPEHQLSPWALLYLGETEFRLKRADVARQLFAKYLEDYPDGPLRDDAQFGLARALEATGDRQQALVIYRDIASRPGSTRAADAQFNVGAIEFDAGNHAAAAEAFRDVAENSPQHQLVPLANLNAGYALFHLGKFDEAISFFERDLSNPMHAENARYWMGLSYKSLGRTEDAIDVFSKSYEENPAQPLAENLLFHWADCQFRQEQFDAARKRFLDLVATFPKGELADDALHSAVEASLRNDDLEQAAALHDRFTEEYATSGLRLLQEIASGRILIAQGDRIAKEDPTQAKSLWQQANTRLEQVVTSSKVPQTANYARLQQGRALERLQEWEAITSTVTPILESEPKESEDYRDALRLRATAALQSDQPTQAVTDFEALLESPSPDHQLSDLAGLVRGLAGTANWNRLGEALTTLKSADSADETFSRVCVEVGDVAFDAEAWQPAMDAFQLVASGPATSPYYPAALSGLGHAQFEAKDFAAAAQTFDSLRQLDLDDSALLSHATYLCGLSLQQAGRLEEGRTVFAAGIDKFKSDDATPPETPQQVETARNVYRCAKGAARASSELKELEQSDKYYEQALAALGRLRPDEQGERDLLLNEWAALHYNAENFDRADDLYGRLVTECPKSPLKDDAQLILAESARFAGRLDEARESFEKLAALPEADEFVRMRSLIHLLDLQKIAGDWSAVQKTGEQFLGLFDESDHESYVQFRLGEALLQNGELAGAESTLAKLKEELTATDENRPEWWAEVWLLLAETQFRLKKYADVASTLADLRERAPDAPLLYRSDLIQGRTAEQQALFDEARTAYQRVIDSEHGKNTETAAEAQFRIAETYLKQKNYDEALKNYYKVYVGHRFPELQAAGLYQAARCDAALKRWREAVTSYQTLVDEFPESDHVPAAQEQLTQIRKYLDRPEGDESGP